MIPFQIKRVRTPVVIVSAAITVVCSSALGAEPLETVALFNGRDLTGWRPTGSPDAWSVHHGMIESNGTGGGWLMTQAQYEDFVLTLRYKVAPGCNSGLAIRCTPTKPAFSGMELQILDDCGGPANRHASMSVYASIAPARNMSRPAGQWNDVQVTCRGRHLEVVWNGQKVQDVDLDAHRELTHRVPRGHIALQDHGHYVWFRDVRIQPLDHADGWEPLLGADISAWKQIGAGKWDFDGYGTVTATGELGVLISPKQYGDFVLRLQSRVSKDGNGGLFVRLPAGAGLDPKPWETGYEIQMQDDHGKPATNVSTGSVVLLAAPKSNLVRPPDVWNDYEVTCRGRTITVKMNGSPVTQAQSDRSMKGHIGLESEAGRVQYRSVKLKPLSN